jgi:transposase
MGRPSWFTHAFEADRRVSLQILETVVSTMMQATSGRFIVGWSKDASPRDKVAGLTHIGVDELPYRKHHKYVTIVVDRSAKRGRAVGVREERRHRLRRAFKGSGARHPGRPKRRTENVRESQ